jgi:hypothetical protein
MRIRALGIAVLSLFLALASRADTIITHEGSSYSGQFLGAKASTIGFTDTSGIGYTFPVREVQSLVFTSANDTGDPAQRHSVFRQIHGH